MQRKKGAWLLGCLGLVKYVSMVKLLLQGSTSSRTSYCALLSITQKIRCFAKEFEISASRAECQGKQAHGAYWLFFFSEVAKRWMPQFFTFISSVFLSFTQWILCFDKQLRNLLGQGVLLFERTADVYQTEWETRQKNSAIFLVRGPLLVQVHLQKISGSWTFPPSSHPRWNGVD